MKSDRLSQRSRQGLPAVPVPPVVDAIAARLAWVTRGDEHLVAGLLSQPYLHGQVIQSDHEQLLVQFPFFSAVHTGMSTDDYTLALVNLWLAIEAQYTMGNVLPEDVLNGLKETMTITHQRDCQRKYSDISVSME
ncbi:hypothetical protein DT73_26105 [Mangrovibacter sp. MFB070]|uniref:hypothetical protein n=1 Tax=Mangrovibacter sp. MFB070 TaxID=1224318 RepID=UPI0004DB1E2C|nr:hypothetical protein [Mangrovibacter sp. MFB070]KEA49916.1 hypothetical protein DT73_26105 [Mangrovibacter sp. MFB070]